MERTAKLVAFNLVLTAATLIACLVVGWAVGAVSGSIAYPEQRQLSVGSYVNVHDKKKQADHMGRVLTFSAWSGLAIAQSVFLARHLGRDATQIEGEISSNG